MITIGVMTTLEMIMMRKNMIKIMMTMTKMIIMQGWAPHILLHSERIVLLRSFKERNVPLRSFFLLDPKEQCVLLRSFAKNVKEHKERNVLSQKKAECCVLLKRTHAQLSFFFSIYIYRYT